MRQGRFEPVQFRHGEVEHRNLRPVFQREFDGRSPVGGFRAYGPTRLLLQELFQTTPDNGVVVGDQNAQHAFAASGANQDNAGANASPQVSGDLRRFRRGDRHKRTDPGARRPGLDVQLAGELFEAHAHSRNADAEVVQLPGCSLASELAEPGCPPSDTSSRSIRPLRRSETRAQELPEWRWTLERASWATRKSVVAASAESSAPSSVILVSTFTPLRSEKPFASHLRAAGSPISSRRGGWRRYDNVLTS
jgi:hypothetical protein